jgi:hypothetical protein
MAVIVSSSASHSTSDATMYPWSRLNNDIEENGNGKQISAAKDKNGKKVF